MMQIGSDGRVPFIMFKKRELRLLRLLVEGKDSKEIAALLFVSVNTVNGHVADLGRGVGEAHSPPRPPLSARELMIFALQNDALKSDLVFLRDHPDNCGCQASYCQTTYVEKQ